MLSFTKSISKPKVVFLDWYKTLSKSLFWEQLSDKNHPFHHLGQKITDWLFVENTDKFTDKLKAWMRGEQSAEEVCSQICQDLGVSFETVFTELVKSSGTMKYCNISLPEIVQQIRSQGRKVVIATDNMDTFMRFTVPALDLQDQYDDILVSSEIGAVKDDYESGTSLFFANFMKTQITKFSNTSPVH